MKKLILILSLIISIAYGQTTSTIQLVIPAGTPDYSIPYLYKNTIKWQVPIANYYMGWNSVLVAAPKSGPVSTGVGPQGPAGPQGPPGETKHDTLVIRDTIFAQNTTLGLANMQEGSMVAVVNGVLTTVPSGYVFQNFSMINQSTFNSISFMIPQNGRYEMLISNTPTHTGKIDSAYVTTRWTDTLGMPKSYTWPTHKGTMVGASNDQPQFINCLAGSQIYFDVTTTIVTNITGWIHKLF